jgi:2-oxo-3-hexenedioate decarboxylase
MQIADGAEISLQGRIHPRIEPEIAFILGKDLEGPISAAQALLACSGVCAALEIIDSRYKNFEFQLPDVVADNCSASGFILGPVVRRPDFDLGNLGMVLEVNGSPVHFASSAAILGHPVHSLVELVRMLSEREQGLRAGSIVLAGGATAAVPLKAGDQLRVQVQGLGAATVKVAGEKC